MNQTVSNPNDFKVVDFTNRTDFVFTPEMGCMYDSNPIFGISGVNGIAPGESKKLPYHVGQRLAINLAKIAMVRGSGDAPQLDANGQPIIKAIWDTSKLESLTKSYITDLYSEDKPVPQTETQKLMAKVEEYKTMVDALISKSTTAQPPADNDHILPGAEQFPAPDGVTYQDKAEVIAELEKKNIPHDKRKSKAELEKLLSA